MSLTLKADGTHAAPWVTIPDSREALLGGQAAAADLNDARLAELQREYIIDLFGFDRASVADLSTYEVFMRADAHHRAVWAAGDVLGGTPVTTEQPAEKPASKPRAARNKPAAKAAEATPDVTPTAEPEPPAPHKYQDVLDAIAAAESVKDVQQVFLANKAAFEDADVAEAAQARTQAVK